MNKQAERVAETYRQAGLTWHEGERLGSQEFRDAYALKIKEILGGRVRYLTDEELNLARQAGRLAETETRAVFGIGAKINFYL